MDLCHKNPSAYQDKIKAALSPGDLDIGGFETLPALLEHTGALNPGAIEVL